MRKFTLILASLFLSLGAWAQTNANGSLVTFTNVQKNGAEAVLYINDDGVLDFSPESAAELGEAAQFRATQQSDGTWTFYNEAKELYMIWRGNGGGYDNNDGLLATYSAEWCHWTVEKSTNLSGGFFFHAKRGDRNENGTIVKLANGSFDKFSSVEGWHDRYSNVYRIDVVDHFGFEPAKDNASINKWYYLTLNKFYLYNDGTSDEMYASKNAVDADDKDAYTWAFIGNPFDGYKLANKKGGYLNCTDGGAIVGDAEHTFTLTASTYHQPNGFFMAGEGKQRYNRNGVTFKIVYWSGADGGSTFNVEPANLVGEGTAESPYLINNVYDLVFFRNSVNAGETTYNREGVYVALDADIDLAGVADWEPIGSWDYTFDGNFDGQGHKIMNLKMNDNSAANGEAYLGLFGITANNVIKDFVIENVTIESAGQIVAAAIAYPYYTTVSDITVSGDITIKGGNYTAGVLAYTGFCTKASNLTVAGNKGSTITGATTVGGVLADIQMDKDVVAEYSNFSVSGVTIKGTKAVGGITGIIAGQTLNGCSVENVTLVSGDGLAGVVAGRLGDASTISNVVTEEVTGATAIIGATYDGAKPVEAMIGYTYYATLEAALAAEGNEVELLVPYVVAAGETVELDLNGKTVSQTKECTASYEMISNKGNLTIKNGTLRFTDTSAGDPNFGWGSYTVRNEGDLVIEDATIEHLGNQAFATHCIMAIYQYCGSTTINGGTISTPNYRSVRLWKGDMTINGGIFNGQVWLQAIDNTANLTINGGTFAPRGNDGSSVYVDNSSKTVSFAVTGGNFTTKIGAANPTAIAGAITGGNFTQNAMNGTNTALLGDGLSFGDVAEGNDYYTLFTLREDVAYENDSDMKINGKIAYTRNLTAFWNPIYLPFDVVLSTEHYDVAEFESAAGATITLRKLTANEEGNLALSANTAYVIRPKNEAAKTLTITLENATLKAATVNTKGLGTDFSVRGNYSVLKGENLGANDRIVSKDGEWAKLAGASTLKPYRLILTIPSTAKAISMRVEGEDATSIENLGITIESDVIYDLMGRRVETMTEGGIYIVNGKKIVF